MKTRLNNNTYSLGLNIASIECLIHCNTGYYF